MSIKNVPLASLEVRWYFKGSLKQNQDLMKWFKEAAPVEKKDHIGELEWKERTDDYLLIPGADDMGIKWREGEFQIKGRKASLGTQVFCDRFQGNVERWMKWSYKKMPEPYRQLFVEGQQRGFVIATVHKVRALRKMRLNKFSGKATEVDPETFLDRGIGFELTQLEVAAQSYVSMAFEAFPDDSALDAAFTPAVEAFLDTLTGVDLTAADSLSYPVWLESIMGAT